MLVLLSVLKCKNDRVTTNLAADMVGQSLQYEIIFNSARHKTKIDALEQLGDASPI